MDDHKLVMISFFLRFLKHEKNAIFMKICLENTLRFERIHENKILFLFFFKLILKIFLKIFWSFFF
jgi:hypothetical protein